MELKIALLLGSAGLALWTYARFAARTPTDWRLVLAHIAASALVLNAVMPAGLRAVVDAPAPASAVIGVVGVALPALSYAFLAALWLLAFAHRALGGALR